VENKSYTKKDILDIIKKEKILFVRLQFIDILGMPKNIVIPPERLDEALDKGIPFDGSSIAGYATIEESDKIALPDPNSFIILPEN
jgi:glutamine synthetase